ncbi:methionine--tRNA ligase [Candidatus Azambacteria bacterium]|nr:methionine--tRNA ligase [Candidatus Azambacteria bacterium]
MSKKFYLTTSIAYVNAPPHIGYALELVQADVIARYHRIKGEDVFFLTGTDEHGRKIVQAAEKLGKPTEEFVDENSEKFRALTNALNISNDDFIRTSDQKRHWPGVHLFWRRLEDAGDLYKKEYEGLYCVGHEAFLKKSDLADGKCPDHGTEPEVLKEENYFFRLSRYQDQLLKRYESGEIKILPESRKNEVLAFIREGLEDVSFSRPSKDLPWGVPVPDDPSQTIYVWAEALLNYVTGLGFGGEEARFNRYWPADIHFIGKDILRFHAIIWPAMFLSAGLPLPKQVNVHGWLTLSGEKISKTKGNTVDPFELVSQYGVDPVRYFLLREIPSGEDGDFSIEKLEERYTSDLANGLGNLVSRVFTLAERNNIVTPELVEGPSTSLGQYQEVAAAIERFELHKALEAIWQLIKQSDEEIDREKLWELAENDRTRFQEVIQRLLHRISAIGELLQPFLPETAEKILDLFGGEKLKAPAPLFPRIQ